MPRPAPAGQLQLQDDEPLLRHLAHGPRRAFARVAGVLDAAVGHLVGAERRRLVHGDAAELERAARRGARFTDEREDPGLEPVARPIRELDRLVERVVRLQRADGAEGLVAGELCVGGGCSTTVGRSKSPSSCRP